MALPAIWNISSPAKSPWASAMAAGCTSGQACCMAVIFISGFCATSASVTALPSA
jgi:hypothetical protein